MGFEIDSDSVIIKVNIINCVNEKQVRLETLDPLYLTSFKLNMQKEKLSKLSCRTGFSHVNGKL